MQYNNALSPKLGAPSRFGIEVVLSFAAHQNLTVLGNLKAFGE